jgi:hypothetical protein
MLGPDDSHAGDSLFEAGFEQLLKPWAKPGVAAPGVCEHRPAGVQAFQKADLPL